MALTLSAAPAVEPVSATEAKAWLRVDNTDEDTLITTLIESARRYAEHFTQRQLITATWLYTRDHWPEGRRITLPYPPLASVTHVKYLDETGTLQTLNSAYYTVHTAPEPGYIELDYDQSWPSLYDQDGAVRITFISGYGAAGASVPAPILVAIRYMIAHWFESREPIVTGTIVQDIPETSSSLLWQYRTFWPESP